MGRQQPFALKAKDRKTAFSSVLATADRTTLENRQHQHETNKQQKQHASPVLGLYPATGEGNGKKRKTIAVLGRNGLFVVVAAVRSFLWRSIFKTNTRYVIYIFTFVSRSPPKARTHISEFRTHSYAYPISRCLRCWHVCKARH